MAEFSFTYRAFISYAHADHEWGVWLHRALERYRVPKRLVGAQNLRRLGRMFRDEEELGAAHELGPKIEAALKASDALIVVCSPRSAKSKWVNQEIEAFKRLGREHRVFALIVDGTPHGAPDVQGNATECFPPGLKVTATGGPAEPLAVDVRKFGREDAALRLIAGMLDVGYDDLRQREVRRRRAELRRAQALFASGLVLVAAALTGGWFAASNYVDASERTSRLFAREANTLFDEGDYAKAMLVALYGDPAAKAGWVEALMRPSGFDAARNALARGLTHNRLGGTFHGHEGYVSSIALLPDGQRFLTGSGDGSVKLWRLGEQAALATFEGHEGNIFSVTLHPDGERFLTLSEDRKPKLWRIGEEQPVAMPTLAAAYSAAFHPDGERFLTGLAEGDVLLWRLGSDFPLATFAGHTSVPYAIVFHPDGERFLTASNDGSAKLWRIGEEAPLASFDASHGPVHSIALHRDGEQFITGAADGTATLWRIGTEQSLATFAGHAGAVDVAFHPDGERLLTASENGAAMLWRLSDRKLLNTFAGHEGEVFAVSLHPDGELFFTGGRDGTKAWRIAGDKPSATFTGHVEDVTAIAVNRDGERFLTGSSDETMKLWRVGEEAPLETYPGRPTSLAFSPNGEEFVAGSFQAATLWRLGTDKPSQIFQQGNFYVNAVAFHADGERFLAGDEDGVVNLWRIGEQTPLSSLKAHEAEILSLSWQPGGELFITGGGEGTAKLWRIGEAEPLASFDAQTDGAIREVRSVAFHPDGQRFLTGSLESRVKLWSIVSDKPLAVFPADSRGIPFVVFNSRGDLFLTVVDGGMKLWRIGEERPLATFEQTGSAAVFLPDGGRFLSDGSDGAAQLWAVPRVLFAPASEQVIEACDMLERIGVTQLTEADYARFPILDRNAPHPCAKIWATTR